MADRTVPAESHPAPADSPNATPSDQQPASPAPVFKRYYTPHELERERIRRELAEPNRLHDLNPSEAKRG